MGLTYRIPLWKHQLEAVERAKNLSGFALFLEMGTGKTATAINILRHKYFQAKRVLPTLILGPPIILENWRREILAHSQITSDKILVLTGTGKKRLAAFEKATAKNPNLIVVTNYESLLMAPLFKALHKWRPACVVADESHRCKDPRAKRAKAAVALADNADRCRLILTGTPVLNSPMDLFGQYRIMDGGAAFGRNFVVFRNTYFRDRNEGLAGTPKYFPDWVPRDSAVAELNRIVNRTAMHVKKSECLSLPPLVRKTIEIELSPVQKRLYKELREDLITFLNDKACTAPIALTRALRLQQIVSGYAAVMNDAGEGENVAIKDNPRLSALGELLGEIAPFHKVIVWAVFKENYAAIRRVLKALELEYVEVHGEIAAAQKLKNVDTFNDDSRCRVLLGHPGSGGIGINLVAANHAIFYSRNFSLEQDLQAEARNYRGGSERHVSITRIDLVARGTIDEVTMKALASKQEMGDKLLRRLQDEL